MLDIALPPLAYLFGSISSAILVCRAMGLPDPRASGSNNPGATNVLRIGGKTAAAIALAGDALKGVLPMLAAHALGAPPTIIALVGACAFLGHLYPVFFAFKGGKGVATAAGVLGGLNVVLIAGLIVVWLTTALVFRRSSLAALIAAAMAPVLIWLILPEQREYFVMAMMIAVLLAWRHRQNIRRLWDGTESKITFTSGTSGADGKRK